MIKRTLALIALAFVIWSPGFAGDGIVLQMARPISNQYIFLIGDDVVETAQQVAIETALEQRATVLAVWDNFPRGFALEFLVLLEQTVAIEPPPVRASQVSFDPRVDHAEQASFAEFSGLQGPPLPWNLDRVDQPSNPLDQSYWYQYDGSGVGGSPVYAYVFDTGIRGDHVEFQNRNGVSRVKPGVNYIRGPVDMYADTYEGSEDGTTPCETAQLASPNGGHGTAVASILGGNKYGVTKTSCSCP